MLHIFFKIVALFDQASTNNFDFVWAPLHDNLKGPNTFSTLLSPGRVNQDLLRNEADKWSEKFSILPKPFLTIFHFQRDQSHKGCHCEESL